MALDLQSGPSHAEPPANVRLGADNFLLDHLGGGFDLLVFGSVVPADVQASVERWKAKGLKLRVLLIGQDAGAAGADLRLSDDAGRARKRWGVTNDGAAYLLRPDQHVCARWVTLDAHRLNGALNAALSLATAGVAA